MGHPPQRRRVRGGERLVTGSTAQARPCATCPYRLNVPAGVWAADEYRKLPEYDRPTGEQPLQAFGCHQRTGDLCAGWLGYGDPAELLAVRIGISTGAIDPSVVDYSTDVPLHPSGTAAAEHGLSGIGDPDEAARAAIDKLTAQREV